MTVRGAILMVQVGHAAALTLINKATPLSGPYASFSNLIDLFVFKK